MALTDILEKISQEASEQIKKLEADFKEKKKLLEQKYEKKQKKIDEDLHQKVEEKSQKIIERAGTLADMEGKNALLNAKRTLIEGILDEALEKLAGSSKYEEVLASMLKAVEIEGDNIVVVPAKGKEEETKTAVKTSGKSFFVSDKSADIRGGFILKTDKVEVDNSFETILNKQLREDLEISLNKTLF